jgi:hypothetical protein
MSDKEFSNYRIAEKILLSEITYSTTENYKILSEISNIIYLEKRKNIIDYLSQLVKGYDYPREIFYFALELVDKLLIFNQNLTLDLTVIACFLISGKNN